MLLAVRHHIFDIGPWIRRCMWKQTNPGIDRWKCPKQNETCIVTLYIHLKITKTNWSFNQQMSDKCRGPLEFGLHLIWCEPSRINGLGIFIFLLDDLDSFGYKSRLYTWHQLDSELESKKDQVYSVCKHHNFTAYTRPKKFGATSIITTVSIH